ncbi:AMP-binding protein [Actinoallomurus rhizosphaericola]|uniref:AMP-binding protein n=1 Tax=Actinoallomurus rhizosphaericola TaxID=2952536 RepID=UPI0020931E9A|nr:AMP-binding protein [Actinoallomurus rhizosphaericola]MCO5998960.1 AMP-binding protein [Actinoallomurus rhizosphaericola]
MTPDVAAFRSARDFLLANAEDYETAYRDFRWPEVAEFNWALEWFDGVLAAETPDRLALWIVEEDGSELKLTFAELADRSSRVAGWLRAQGVRRGERILLMLGNQVELWETMLAAMKLGAVVVPATTLLTPDDLRDRIARGGVSHVVTGAADTAKFADLTGEWTRICVGTADGWLAYGDAYGHEPYDAAGTTTNAGDTLLLYFTSGTTARPKLVEHTYASYPVGHLSTMYWIGLRPGDVHLNVSSPGWAKHAWSNVFAPWNAGACVLVLNYARFSAPALLEVMRRCEVTTFCAPPTVWRMLIQEDLRSWNLNLRITVAAGEPLNPEIIDQVREQWGLTVRDGYGQTETTAQIGNSPGQPLKPGSMGRPLPGYRIALIDPVSGEPADEGEVCIDLSERPVALMAGYRDASGRTDEAMDGGYYHTGDVASVDADGYVTFVGRTDDVFKASDYKISPFELESVLLEHEAVAEAAVVPAADPVRLAVPKAYVSLAAGHEPTAETARSILAHSRQRLAAYKRVRRLEFGELPKTISGKIRRVELRGLEDADRRAGEYREEDFPDLRS